MLLPLLLITLFAQTPLPTGEKLAPYYPTPATIVDRMLELGQLKPGESAIHDERWDIRLQG